MKTAEQFLLEKNNHFKTELESHRLRNEVCKLMDDFLIHFLMSQVVDDAPKEYLESKQVLANMSEYTDMDIQEAKAYIRGYNEAYLNLL